MSLIDYIDHFVITFIHKLNLTYYTGIILDAFNSLLCSKNYAGIIGLGLDTNNVINTVMHTCNSHGMLICAVTCSVVIYMAIVKKLVQQVPLI